MGQALYVERGMVPLAEAGKEVMLVFRDAGSDGARAAIYVTALRPNTVVEVTSGRGADTDRFTPVTTLTLPNRNQTEMVRVPVSTVPVDQVSVVRVLRGSVSVTAVSPTRVQTEFRTRKNP